MSFNDHKETPWQKLEGAAIWTQAPTRDWAVLDLKQSQYSMSCNTNEGGQHATHPLYIYPGQIAFDPYFEQPLEIMNFATPRLQGPPYIILARLFRFVRLFPNALNWAVSYTEAKNEINGRK